MSQCVEVRRACAAAHPQSSLTCGFESGIVTLTLRPQSICPLEIEPAAVNACSHRGQSCISCSPGFSSHCSNSCGCRDTRLFWIDGKGNSISGGYVHYLLFSPLCIASSAARSGLPAESVLEAFVL